MTHITDPLAMDWLAANPSVTPSALQNTTLGYDSAGRVTSVTLPAPDGATSSLRPQKTYVYGSGTTTVDVAGLSLPSGAHAQTVTYDTSWRQLTSTSAMGVTASQVWNGKDMVLSATDPQGLMSTTIYNQQDRPTDTYGPAPASCFDTNRVPSLSCPILAAHSSTGYDSGLTGLHAAYYANPNLSGPPKLFNLGLFGSTGGAVDSDWVAAAPNANLPADNWSARLTGLISFPATGSYTLQTLAGDGTRVWIDDVLYVDNWTTQTTATRRATVLLMVFGAGVLGLTGCEQLSDPRLAAVKLDGGNLSIAICRTTDVRQIILERRYDGDREDLWVVSGDARIESGQVLTAALLGELFDAAEVKPIDLPDAAQLTLIVRAAERSDNIVVAFDADHLDADRWLKPDNSSSSDPCSA